MTHLTTQTPALSTLSDIISRSGAKSSSEALPLEILYNLQYQHKWTDLKLHQIPVNSSTSSTPNHASGTPSTSSDANNDSTSQPPILDASPLHLAPLAITSAPFPPDSRPSSPAQGTTSPSSPPRPHPQILISGLPPRQIYTHPDLLSHLVSVSQTPDTLPVEREYVLPLAIGQTWPLRRMAGVFDGLPEREAITMQGKGEVNGDGERGKASHVHRDKKRVVLGMLARNGVGGDGTVVYYIVQEGEVKPRQN